MKTDDALITKHYDSDEVEGFEDGEDEWVAGPQLNVAGRVVRLTHTRRVADEHDRNSGFVTDRYYGRPYICFEISEGKTIRGEIIWGDTVSFSEWESIALQLAVQQFPHPHSESDEWRTS